MFVAAAFVGLAAGPLWTSQATYISRIARYHEYHKRTAIEIITSLFFGYFFAVFNTSVVWGNLISYFVLKQSNHPNKSNCGIYFNPLSKSEIIEVDDVSQLTVSHSI